jgi:hypothetical protein
MSRPLHPPPCLNCAAPSKTTQNRPGNALASLVPLNLLGDPPKRLKPVDKAAWREMQEHGFWLTSADQFMVEIAAPRSLLHCGPNMATQKWDDEAGRGGDAAGE